MSDGGQSRFESLLWGLVLLVGPVGLVWEFGTSIRHTLPLPGSLPIKLIDHIEVVMYILAIVLGGGTLLAFIYAAVRYADVDGRRPASMPVNWRQRTFITWMAVVISVLLITATVGATTLMTVDSDPAPSSEKYNTEGSMTYKVVGVQWTWMVKPVEPKHLPFMMRRTIRVPANTTIHLEITSKDVIHSFAIQELGVKKDAVPGQVNDYWFVARDPGRYQINCAELCGAAHSQMTPELVVMPRDEYAQWVVDHGGTNPFEQVSVRQNQTSRTNTTQNQTSQTNAARDDTATTTQNAAATAPTTMNTTTTIGAENQSSASTQSAVTIQLATVSAPPRLAAPRRVADAG